MNRREFNSRLVSAAALAGLSSAARGAAPGRDAYILKLSHYAPAVHHQHAVTFVNWAKELDRRSGGRLKLDIYPAEQLGKMSQQYNLVRRGDVDIAFFMHGTPAGRFPLMELTHLPMLFKSGEQTAYVLMSLVPDYLAAEHKDVKILYLFGHSPGVLHTRSRPVRKPEDLRGLRIRHPSSVVGETLRAWGASPAGMPPGEVAANLDKGVIDGLVIPYDGVAGFRLGPYLRYSTEVFSYVNSFGVVMNPASYERLPADLKHLIDDTTGMPAALTVGARWDSMEIPAKKYCIDSGIEIIGLTDAERQRFADAAQSVVDRRLADTEAKGLPAREFFARVKALAADYLKRSPPR
jgi:TRAP-type transport system periplasmic protein